MKFLLAASAHSWPLCPSEFLAIRPWRQLLPSTDVPHSSFEPRGPSALLLSLTCRWEQHKLWGLREVQREGKEPRKHGPLQDAETTRSLSQLGRSAIQEIVMENKVVGKNNKEQVCKLGEYIK